MKNHNLLNATLHHNYITALGSVYHIYIYTHTHSYIPQSIRNPARAAVHCVSPSSNMRWYVVGIIKLPHTAGTSLSANNGTSSGYELPIRSNLNCPKIAKFRLCQYFLQHLSIVTYLWHSLSLLKTETKLRP